LFAKRIVDVILSGSALLVFSPVLAAVAIAIKLDSPGPVIFRQTRVGKDGNFFEILKFRTMRQGTPQVATDLMLKMEQSPITIVGEFLRKTSLDELPQLINVLRGDMSLVGPRPALYNQSELTAKPQAAGALRMLQGITGWAQVNGRDELVDDVKVEYDKWYCEHWSLILDLRIIFRTVAAVLNRRGAL
jgi:O-antigen biosynthesis protein WbqP